MRPFTTAFVLSLAACSFAPASTSGKIPGPQGPHEPVPPPVSDQHEFGPAASMQPGQWVRYRIERGLQAEEITLGVAARDGERAWLEVVEEGDPRRASLRLVTRGDRVEKALFREVPKQGDPGPIVPQAVEQGEPPSDRAIPDAPAQAVEDSSAGRTIKARSLTLVQRDELLGREERREYVWSDEVPPLFSEKGLIRRATSREKVQLLDFGTTGYVPLIPAPK